MTATQVFSFANLLVAAGWLILIRLIHTFRQFGPGSTAPTVASGR